MKQVCVITGGGSGMGLATAKVLGKDNYILIVGRTQNKLENAVAELACEGIEAEYFVCDVSDRDSVNELVAKATSLGNIFTVINAAGLSPNMGNAKALLQVNAIGTINIHEAFYEVMEEGSSIIDVSSMSGHMVPSLIIPKKLYRLSRTNKDLFLRKMMNRIKILPGKLKAEVAYAVSKNFVIWYSKTDAVKFGNKGMRVLSVSPGFFETPMGELEKKRTDAYIKNSAIKRMGHVEEIANLLSFCVSDKASYLTGTDILCDGGCIASG
ncbi:SDR family oxidoreductase [Saccharicrinis sp. FJH2]|uniref:SDR family oxidoreductase n=1 Tax=Saccharicrinis sp. FJH65 TaxID=3344659 RepID=UPI0035F2312D